MVLRWYMPNKSIGYMVKEYFKEMIEINLNEVTEKIEIVPLISYVRYYIKVNPS